MQLWAYKFINKDDLQRLQKKLDRMILVQYLPKLFIKFEDQQKFQKQVKF